MAEQEDLLKLFKKAFFFLKFRPRTKEELQRYLYKKIRKTHWSQSDADYVIKDLEEQGLINDKEFIRWFVEQRNILKPKSTRFITQELLRLGVDKQDIEDYFEKHKQDEDQLIFDILKKRWQRYRSLGKHERFEKAASFLARRGFNFDLVKTTIEKLENS